MDAWGEGEEGVKQGLQRARGGMMTRCRLTGLYEVLEQAYRQRLGGESGTP